MTSCLLRFWPSCPSQLRHCRRPSMSAARPFLRYSLAVSAWRPNATTSTKQTSSRRSLGLSCPPRSGPLCPARGVFTARPKDATGVPLGVERSSGSRVRLPSKRTLLKLAHSGKFHSPDNSSLHLCSSPLHLLSAPLTIPLVCCHIKSFRRAW